VGVLGWLDTPLPAQIHFLWWVALALALLAESARRTRWWGAPGRLWILFVALLCASVIHLIFSVIYTQPGLTYVEGVQGRYLFPLLPLLVFVVGIRFRSLRPAAPGLRALSMLLVGVLLLGTLARLYHRYWVALAL